VLHGDFKDFIFAFDKTIKIKLGRAVLARDMWGNRHYGEEVCTATSLNLVLAVARVLRIHGTPTYQTTVGDTAVGVKMN